MNQKVTPNNLEAAIKEILTEYTEQVATDVKSAVEETGKMTAELASSYASAIGRGQYAKSIKSKITATNDFETTVTVYSTKYRIAHLLEHGHPIVKKGKVVGSAKGFPHFSRAEARAESVLEQKVRQAIGGK